MNKKEVERKKEMDEQRHQKKLNQSQLDLKITKTKQEFYQLENNIKQQHQAEQLLERQKMFAENPIVEANPIQVIKKAQIFEDDEYKENLRNLER